MILAIIPWSIVLIKEWSSQFNPFNSMKVLVWREWLEACAREEYLPPVAVAIDPTNRCNFNCIFCNAYDIRCEQKQELSEEHLINLSRFLAQWGVKANCIAGGGEPTLAKGFISLLKECKRLNISNSVITNGSCMSDEIIQTMAETCKWVGISIDAGSKSIFQIMKGVKDNDMFSHVINNIKRLRKCINDIGSECTIGYKFLIHPYNQGEIYKAAELAKEIGANDFQARPVGWDNLTITNGLSKLEYDIDIINKQFEAARELETETFRVYGIQHKFGEGFKRKNKFSRCWCIPMHPTFAADGNVYLCLDKRGKQDEIICRHNPYPSKILKHWNTLRHKEMVRNVDINKCPRCTFNGYNEICENVFVKDKMCRYHI